MTKEPPADAVPPVESYELVPPLDDTMLGHPGDGDRALEPAVNPGEGRPGATADDRVSRKGDGARQPEVRPGGGAREDLPAARGDADDGRAQPWPGLAAEDQGWPHPEQASPAPASPPWTSQDPAHLETVPGAAVPPPGPVKPVRIGRGTGRLPSRLITAYFAGGLALLLAGTVAVFYLAFKAYGSEPGTTVADPGTYPSQSRPSARPPAAAPVSPGSARPSVPLRARFGPQQLANGQSFVVQGEGDARFRITVKAGKFRKGGCDAYAVKPEEGGYLPVELKLKVLQGEPEVSEYAFRFQKPNGEWLPSVGGSGCDGRNYGGFFRRLSAGRTYTSSVVFDVPSAKGDIVFVYPLMDVVAAWKVR